MSREEIPWNKVAQEIVRILGTETARAFWFAMVSQNLYPALTNFIAYIASGKAREEEIRKALEEIRAYIQGQRVPIQQPPATNEQLVEALARLLQQHSSSLYRPPSAPAAPAPYSTPTPAPPAVSTELKARLEYLEMEINALKQAIQSLLNQYHLEIDEARKSQLLAMIQQRRSELENKMREYEYLKAQLTWAR